ncbi:MBL fold metallo-hydrolase [Alkalibacterium kapii]|uniref:MBL fold metallo-hydrolase n=1 Tax=Alkalibacterium kapii TaxID=426704 RepID=A0A511AT86_9LACT|nr:MBL fold metallo-hydrolase [Alkalibacterium kapii]GEK91418.1 MBL fold metallo-hydrolase [Alkalibacterium kapii]
MIHFQKNNLTVFQSALFQTTSAVIIGEESIILTDPTWLPHEINEIKEYIDEVKKNRQLYIIYTHSDFDHIIGSGAFSNATVIASKNFQLNSNKQEILNEVAAFDQEYYIERDYDVTYPTVDRVINADGESINLTSMTLTFFNAPGHTADGLFILVEPFGIFLSGDYLSDVEFPFITSSFKDYETTLSRAEWILDNYTVNVHVPGHGSVTDRKDEMRNRISFSKDYLKRLKKHDQTLERDLRKKYQFFEGMKDNHYQNYKYLDE